jgi:hypothetical protein
VKILAVADHIDPLVYSGGIKDRFGDVDLILGAGDLPLSYYDFIASTLNRPLIFIFGNHNLRHLGSFRKSADPFHNPPHEARSLGPERPGGLYVDRRILEIKGVLIAGLGGSRWYNGGENQFTERQMRWRIFRLIPRLFWNRITRGRYLDILLTHAPPMGLNDRADRAHRGFQALIRFIDRYKPKYHIHGHVHLYDRNDSREARHGVTTVVNAYDHVVIDLKDDPIG